MDQAWLETNLNEHIAEIGRLIDDKKPADARSALDSAKLCLSALTDADAKRRHKSRLAALDDKIKSLEVDSSVAPTTVPFALAVDQTKLLEDALQSLAESEAMASSTIARLKEQRSRLQAMRANLTDTSKHLRNATRLTTTIARRQNSFFSFS